MSEQENTQQSTGTPAPQNDGAQGGNTPPEAIPYDRFKQVNDEKKKLADKVAAYEAAEEARKQKEAVDNGEFQKVIDALKPKAERTDALEATLKGYLEAEITTIPEQFRGLIPGGDVTTQLAWIKQAKAQGLFNRTPAPNTDAGATGDPKPVIKLTELEQSYARMAGMTDEEYAKYKNKT